MPSHKVLVVGLGPAGQEVARHLLASQMTPVIIDANPQSRTKAGELDLELHLGDAVHEDVLLHSGQTSSGSPDPKISSSN